jgi:DNA primase
LATRWIDFTELKRVVSERGGIREVLKRYGFLERLKDKGDGKLVGPCPIHGSTDQASTAFHVDCNRDVWHCFSQCTTDRGKSGGGVLELVMLIEHCTLRQAGERLSAMVGGLTFDRRPRGRSSVAKSADVGQATETKAAVATHVSRPDSGVNPPLDRPLQNLNQDHEYLFERGLTMPTIRKFEVGFCSRGLMRGRIAIAIRDTQGELVAYAGRAIDQERAKEEGKYKLPRKFSKKHLLYNLNLAKEHAAHGLIVVEGFFDAMKVHQAGFPNVVALMGCSLSEQQEELLVAHTDRLALMFDGDEAGVKCVREFYGRLRRRMYLREIHLDAGTQPDSLTEDEIRTLLS